MKAKKSVQILRASFREACLGSGVKRTFRVLCKELEGIARTNREADNPQSIDIELFAMRLSDLVRGLKRDAA